MNYVPIIYLWICIGLALGSGIAIGSLFTLHFVEKMGVKL